MPNTTSAEKALRQTKRRKAQNDSRKTSYKQAVKNVRKLVLGKKSDEARTSLPKMFQSVDKAAKRNVISKNKASRLKSRLSQLIAKSTKASS